MSETPDQDGCRRKRAFKPKTRTGCITCRIRRIKCDEGKPHCLKCMSTGRKCDGYLATSSDRRSLNQPQKPPHEETAVVKTSFPRVTVLPFQGSDLELRAFKYFQLETVPQICGFYRDQFWLQSVLQACHHNSAIRHAAIALGSLHEQYGLMDPVTMRRSGDLVAGGFALQQYNKSIKSLVDYTNGTVRGPKQKVDVALITCVLFACFDALRGRLATVFEHIDGGVKILSELNETSSSHDQEKSPRTTDPYVPMTALNQLFTRLDIQSSAMLGSRPLGLGLAPTSAPGSPTDDPHIPEQFSSFEEARNAQDSIFRGWHYDFRRTLTNGAELLFGEVPSEEDLEFLKTKYTGKLNEWSDTYENFLIANPESREQSADHLLRLLRAFIWIHADVDHAASATDETTWDIYKSQFEEIVKHATAIIKSTSKRQKTIFALDTLIISPLYFVASRCRHPMIRRDAIACLFAANRQEGLWESRTVARVAQRVMEIEEEGMGSIVDGSEIPGWKRISGVQPDIAVDGRSAVIHYTSKIGGEGSEPVTNLAEIVEW